VTENKLGRKKKKTLFKIFKIKRHPIAKPLSFELMNLQF